MAIAYYAEDIELPAIKKRAVSGWVKAVAETYGKKTGDISFIFCSDEKILEVNRQYLQHDYYTDIITFDYTEEIRSRVTCSSASIRSGQTPRHSTRIITRNSTVPSSTASCTFAVSTTKVPASGRSWRRTRTER